MARDYAKRRSSSYDDSGRWRWPLAVILLVLFAIGIFYLKKQSDKIAAEQGEGNNGIVQRTLKERDLPASKTPEPKKSNKKSTDKDATPEKPHPESSPQPKFDFYTMLPKSQVATTAPKTINTPPPPPIPTATPKTNTVAAATPTTVASTQPVETTKTTTDNKAIVAADSEDLIAVEIQKLNNTKPAQSTKSTTTNYVLQVGVFKNHASADQYKAQLVMQGYEAKIKPTKNNLYRVWIGPYSTLAAAKDQQHVLQQNQIKSRITKES